LYKLNNVVRASKNLVAQFTLRRITRAANKQAASFDYYNDDFTENERDILDRCLSSYIELSLGRPPDNESEEHVLGMLMGRLPIDTVSMETYIKWQAAKTRHDNPNDHETTGAVFSDLTLTLKTVRSGFSGLRARTTADASALLAAMLSTDLSRPISAWTERTFEGAATIYDKSADAIYNSSHEGGALHRLLVVSV